MWLFYYFDFERNYYVLKSKGPYFLLNKKVNFNKNETDSKNVEKRCSKKFHKIHRKTPVQASLF